MTDPDVFGDIIDADTIEQAVRDTLQAWLPAHLAHQERRKGLPQGTLPQPRSWPTVSEFDLEAHEQLPAVVIVSQGSTGTPERNPKGEYRKTWRFEIAAVIGDKTEREARKLGALYLAAIIGALVQNQTLGGVAESCRNVGPDDHAFGTTERRAQRAIYGTAFEVTVKAAFNDRLGPATPPDDPYHPDPFPPSPLEAEITVTLEEQSP